MSDQLKLEVQFMDKDYLVDTLIGKISKFLKRIIVNLIDDFIYINKTI